MLQYTVRTYLGVLVRAVHFVTSYGNIATLAAVVVGSDKMDSIYEQFAITSSACVEAFNPFM